MPLSYYHFTCRKWHGRIIIFWCTTGKIGIKSTCVSVIPTNTYKWAWKIINFLARHWGNLELSLRACINIADKTSLYYKCCDEINIPRQVEADLAKMEYFWLNSLSAKSVLAGEKLVATYSIST